MAQFLPLALVAAVIFGICFLVDKAFTKLFRSKAQHRIIEPVGNLLDDEANQRADHRCAADAQRRYPNKLHMCTSKSKGSLKHIYPEVSVFKHRACTPRVFCAILVRGDLE